jgi:REP element-mobilizing transposase RayT
MPQSKLREWKEEKATWMQRYPKPWSPEVEQEYYRRFHGRIEKWLDAGMGSCSLRDSEIREIVEKTLMYDEGRRVEHHSWVIMPNHVHMIFSPKVEIALLLKDWKGLSARRIGKGSIWQRGYRDTMIRDGEHFANAVRYIRRNPAKLREGEYTLWESARALGVC